MTRCAWVIHERGDRWSRAVERFAPAMHPAGYTLEKSPTPLRVPPRSAVVLYELAADRSSELLQAMTMLAARPTPPLQIVTLAPELLLAEASHWELMAALRGLGAAAVLRHPEQLPGIARLVHRYATLGIVPSPRRL